MGFQDYSESAKSKLHLGQIRPQVVIGLAVICAVAIGVLLFGLSNIAGASGFQVVEAQSAQAEEDVSVLDDTPEEVTIFVHVTGCVLNPGLYELPDASRVADAINAAGGFSDDACKDALNLAQVLVDGEQISVPSEEDMKNVAAAATPTESSASQSDAASNTSQSSKVNINTADISQLQTISGIGESKAKKIIAYRESNGKFNKIEDLTNVSGIGEKTLESIRDQICV